VQFFVAPTKVISYKDEDLSVPMAAGKSGEYAAVIKGWLSNIMYGKEDHPWGVVIEEKTEI